MHRRVRRGEVKTTTRLGSGNVRSHADSVRWAGIPKAFGVVSEWDRVDVCQRLSESVDERDARESKITEHEIWVKMLTNELILTS